MAATQGLYCLRIWEKSEALTDECAAAFETLEAAIKTLNDLSATSKPNTLEGIATVINATKFIGNAKPLPEKMLLNSGCESENLKTEAEALVSKLRKYFELKLLRTKLFALRFLTLIPLNSRSFPAVSSSF